MAFVVFVIYYVFKAVQLVLVSVNLYKKMVNRQDAMVELLLDIRDGMKNYNQSKLDTKDKTSESEGPESGSVTLSKQEYADAGI